MSVIEKPYPQGMHIVIPEGYYKNPALVRELEAGAVWTIEREHLGGTAWKTTFRSNRDPSVTMSWHAFEAFVVLVYCFLLPNSRPFYCGMTGGFAKRMKKYFNFKSHNAEVNALFEATYNRGEKIQMIFPTFGIETKEEGLYWEDQEIIKRKTLKSLGLGGCNKKLRGMAYRDCFIGRRLKRTPISLLEPANARWIVDYYTKRFARFNREWNETTGSWRWATARFDLGVCRVLWELDFIQTLDDVSLYIDFQGAGSQFTQRYTPESLLDHILSTAAGDC